MPRPGPWPARRLRGSPRAALITVTVALVGDGFPCEDDPLTTSVRRGLSAGLPAQGRFLPGAEPRVIHFQELVLAALS
jgi:hypothetical protein